MVYYLPDECWESIFSFIIINVEDCNNNHYLNSISLVSKQFLSVINRVRFSYTICDSKILTLLSHNVYDSTRRFLRLLFNRYTNLNSLNLNLKLLFIDLNKFLFQISCFPFKLTSLNVSHKPTIPAHGFRNFSQKITTLTSLNCSHIHSLNSSHLLLIAECFPLLEQLDLSCPSGYNKYGSHVDGVEALSLALIKLRKVNLSGFPINNQSLFHLFNNCKQLEQVIIFKCRQITSAGLASALCKRPRLRSLSFSATEGNEVSVTSHFIDSLVSLKGLTCLVLRGLKISDKLLNSIAREGLPLTRLDLGCCTGHSYDGIICLLSKCQRIQHLDLQNTDFLNDHHVVQLSSLFQVDLVSINLSRCWLLTESALFVIVRNCPSLSEIKMVDIRCKGGENSDSLVKLGVYPELKSLYLGECPWLSDETIIMFASIFPNLQILDLNNCNSISEGICQVLRKCCKIRHLNLADCSRVKLLGVNFVVPNLEVLNLSNTNVDDETLYMISKNCRGLLKLLLEQCNGVTENGVKHVLENCTQLRDHGYLLQ